MYEPNELKVFVYHEPTKDKEWVQLQLNENDEKCFLITIECKDDMI